MTAGTGQDRKLSQQSYIDGFSFVESSLYLWDEAYLIMVDDISDVFLNLVCQYFIESFYINVNEGDWSI